MSDPILPGDPPIPLILRRSGRAKRISLRISQLDGRVTLTMPKRTALRDAVAFAHEKETWIRGHLSGLTGEVAVREGASVPIGGCPHRVVAGTGRRVVISAGVIEVPGPQERLARRLASHLREIARERLAEASDHYAARLGKSYATLKLRDTRSRWGSCTSQGGLMYSWRLVMAPSEVLSYVAAHEVAHLAHMNHSPAFWAEVARIHGEYEAPRRWLRKEGGSLHRYRFG
jgi:predicted metal-dependent hydrolase